MYQVDATAETAKELGPKLDEIWAGQPSLADHDRTGFEAQKKALVAAVAASGLEYPLNVTVYFTERKTHPDVGSGPLVTPGHVRLEAREVINA